MSEEERRGDAYEGEVGGGRSERFMGKWQGRKWGGLQREEERGEGSEGEVREKGEVRGGGNSE